MSAIDPRLGEYAEHNEFARMIHRSPRTVSRMIAQPDGLPHLRLGASTLIPIDQARAWLASRVRQPNARRKAS